MSEEEEDDPNMFGQTTWGYQGPLGGMTLFLDRDGTMLVFQDQGVELESRWEIKDGYLFLYIPGASGPHVADPALAHNEGYKGICPREFYPATWTWEYLC